MGAPNYKIHMFYMYVKNYMYDMITIIITLNMFTNVIDLSTWTWSACSLLQGKQQLHNLVWFHLF